jgi:hypothetical protein
MQNEKLKIKSIVLLLGVVATISLDAQAPDFSGTWRLDEAKSKVLATAGMFGLIPAGAPKMLHITQPANGTLVIESQVNEGHSRIYKPGRQSSTPAGQGGAVTVASKWEGKALVSEGAFKAPNGDTTTVREVLSLTDPKQLTLEVTTPAGTSSLHYIKITDVGPCETWPTPCKRFP